MGNTPYDLSGKPRLVKRVEEKHNPYDLSRYTDPAPGGRVVQVTPGDIQRELVPHRVACRSFLATLACVVGIEGFDLQHVVDGTESLDRAGEELVDEVMRLAVDAMIDRGER